MVWMDMEMSGLDPDSNKILEVAVIITDPELNVIAEGPSLIVKQSDEELSNMDEWNTLHHEKSGLTQKVKASKISQSEAEEQLLEFISKWCEPNTAVLAGNSIHQDKAFLHRYMPKVDNYLHYRIIDVTSIRKLANYWYPDVKPFKKQDSHRALDDIKESIEELKYYRENVFK